MFGGGVCYIMSVYYVVLMLRVYYNIAV